MQKIIPYFAEARKNDYLCNMGKMRKLLSSLPPWFLSGLTLALILWLTLAPNPMGDNELELFPGADKIIHAIMFGFLSMMFLLDYQRKHFWKLCGWPAISIGAAISFVTGVCIEFAQEAMSLGRAFEIGDIVADAVGTLIAANIWLILQSNWCLSDRMEDHF